MLVRMVRVLKDTPLFRRNQKCWIRVHTGAEACMVVGKYRGKGRYIEAWLHHPKEYNIDAIQEFEVSEEFAKRLNIFI